MHKLLRNTLTAQIQKRIRIIRNNEWQDKLAKISHANHTLWHTYKITGGPKEKLPVLIDPQTNQMYHSDTEKTEVFASLFASVHDRAFNSISPLEENIASEVRLQHETTEVDIGTNLNPPPPSLSGTSLGRCLDAKFPAWTRSLQNS